MSISQSAIALLCWYACLLGIGLGILYDAFRITRIFLGASYSNRASEQLQSIHLRWIGPYRKHPNRYLLSVVTALEDFLFCILAAVFLILLFYQANNGTIRIPALIALSAGFLCYRTTLGKAVMLFSEWIAFACSTAVRYGLFCLFFPLRVLMRYFLKLCRTAKSGLQKKQRAQYTHSQIPGDGLFPQNRKPKERKRQHAERKKKTV